MSVKAKKTAKAEKPAKAAKAEKAEKAAPSAKKGAKSVETEEMALESAPSSEVSEEDAEEEEEVATSSSSGGGNAAALAAATGSTEMSASFKNFRHHPDMENFYRFIYENDLRLEALTIIDEIMAQKAVRKEVRAAKKTSH